MDIILKEFNNSIEHIKNNFYFSFLSLNFINQKPFQTDIILPVIGMKNNIISSISLNSFDLNSVQEFGNSIRRHFLNDLLIAYVRYSMSMFVSHQNNQKYIEPSKNDNRNLKADNFEKINDIYSSDQVCFLIQLRRLRNSIVHYNGKYCCSNELNFTFGTQIYKSIGNEGKDISIEFDNILWIFNRLKEIVNIGNINYFKFYKDI